MIVFVADFFVDEVLGGGELNNHELIELLRQKGHTVKTIKSQQLTTSFLNKAKTQLYIVANFIGLSDEAKKALTTKNYIIYEHDHKYLRSRNPAHYNNFTAPESELVNVEFYEKAAAVFCQTSFHQSIIERNLHADNIESVGGNLWSTASLDLLEQLALTDKAPKCSVLKFPHSSQKYQRGCGIL